MKHELIFAELLDIPMLYVRGRWSGKTLSAMEASKAEGLVLDSSALREMDLGFLQDVPNLRNLVIGGDFQNTKAVEQLTNLESLTITANVDPTHIDLSNLQKLNYLWIIHQPGTDTLFELPNLETLYLAEYRYKDLAPFENLRKLKKLEIGPAYRLTDISHVSKLAETLEMFGLYYATKLTDFNPLALLTKLTELAIETCSKISNINFLHNLTQLEILKVANCKDIDSLAPMEALQNLQHFYAWQSTKVLDGDLSVLGRLPKLKTVAMARRRHYHGFDLKIG